MADDIPQGQASVTEATPQWGAGPSVVVTSGASRPSARTRKPRRLVVPLLLLAVLLMGATGAVAWLLVQTRDRLQTTERELIQTGAERDELRTQLAQSEEGRVRAEREAGRTRQELTAAEGELSRVNAQREELSRSLEERQRQLDQMTAELDAARGAQAELTRQVSGLNNERGELRQQVASLQDAKQLLETKVLELSQHPTVELDKVLVSGAASQAPAVLPPSVALEPAQPPTAPMAGGLSGQVVVVNREYDFIVMNLGRNHGVTVGQELRIIRDQQELGRVRVEKVYDELSAAALLPQAQEDQIREGDAVVAL